MRRSTRNSSASSTSRRSICGQARSSEWRRSSAGTTRSRGLLPPADFLSLAEETGLIVPIGNWVLEESLRQAEQWRKARPDGDFQISVNLSAPQHEDPNLIRNIETALAATGTDPSNLCLEITETVVMKDVEATLKVLEALKGLGDQAERRRLRHRLLVADLAQALPGRLAQGRPLVRLRPRQRTCRRGRCHRDRSDQPRAQPRPDRRRGGDRDGRAARPRSARWTATWRRASTSPARGPPPRSASCWARTNPANRYGANNPWTANRVLSRPCLRVAVRRRRRRP